MFTFLTFVTIIVPTFLFDFVLYLIPPALLTVAPLWAIKKWAPKLWKPKAMYYVLAAFVGYLYYSYLSATIPKILNDPTFSLSFDLIGENSRAMTFWDLVTVTLANLLHIYFYSEPNGIPFSQTILYMIGSLVGIGHSLFMARIVDDGTNPKLQRPKVATWRVWAVYGTLVFLWWIRIVIRYFQEWGNLDIARNGGGPGVTPGANFTILVIFWATVEFVPYHAMQYKTFWRALLEVMVDYAFVATFFSRQLYLRNRFSDAELPSHGIELDWAATRAAAAAAAVAKKSDGNGGGPSTPTHSRRNSNPRPPSQKSASARK